MALISVRRVSHSDSFDSDPFDDYFTDTEQDLTKASCFGAGVDLIVHVKSARGLKDIHWFSSLEPKVVGFFSELHTLNESQRAVSSHKAFETKQARGTNPEWHETHTLRWSGEQRLVLKIFEGRLFQKDACLGQACIELGDCVKIEVEDSESEHEIEEAGHPSSTPGDEALLRQDTLGARQSTMKKLYSTPCLRKTVSWSSEQELGPDEYPLYGRSDYAAIEVTLEVKHRCIWCREAPCVCILCSTQREHSPQWIAREEYLKHPNVGEPVELSDEPMGGEAMLERFMTRTRSFLVSPARESSVPAMPSGIISSVAPPKILLDRDVESNEVHDLLRLNWKKIRTKPGWICSEGCWRMQNFSTGGPEFLQQELRVARRQAKLDTRVGCETIRDAFFSCLSGFEVVDDAELEVMQKVCASDARIIDKAAVETLREVLPIIGEMREQLEAWTRRKQPSKKPAQRESGASTGPDNSEDLALSPDLRVMHPSWELWYSDHSMSCPWAVRRKQDVVQMSMGCPSYKDKSGQLWVQMPLERPVRSPQSEGPGFRLSSELIIGSPSYIINEDVQKVKAACESSGAGWNSAMEALCGRHGIAMMRTQKGNYRMSVLGSSDTHWWAFPPDVLERETAFRKSRPATPEDTIIVAQKTLELKDLGTDLVPLHRPAAQKTPEPILKAPRDDIVPVQRHSLAVKPISVARRISEPRLAASQAPGQAIVVIADAKPQSRSRPGATPLNPRTFLKAQSVGPVPGSQASSIASVFKQFDANGDGMIDREELEVLCDHFGFGIGAVDSLLVAADLNGNSKIAYEEFASWICDSGDTLAESFVHLRAVPALAYKLELGEELYVPVSRLQARLLLRSDNSFSYVPRNMARFSDGVQGIYERNGDKVTLIPEYFGASTDQFDPKSFDVVLTSDLLDHRGPRFAGCKAMHLPEAAVFEASWLNPS
eukprot:TRINITY_DN66345_c0_g1_i1.p1 TRINITY_DN66345_c0_g1~~TRINITY_DN66345_c0_g1_i1.p1  ORF type:complete len:957 (-),score=93.94 TRINITY_DN66345_c0_g1_i1:48-2873(-)